MMRIETKEIIDNINSNRKKTKVIIHERFNNEKDFQIWLGRELIKYGFDVYTDKKICELKTFKGNRQKPDLLIFFNENFNKNKIIKIKCPIAIEIKYNGCKNNKFANISKSILQIKKYKGKRFFTDNWKGEINNIFLCTNDLIFNNKVYNWDVAKHFYNDTDFHEGMYWTLIRILSTVSNQSGFLNYDGINFTIETPNSTFYLLDYGNIGYRPTKYNNGGKLE